MMTEKHYSMDYESIIKSNKITIESDDTSQEQNPESKELDAGVPKPGNIEIFESVEVVDEKRVKLK